MSIRVGLVIILLLVCSNCFGITWIDIVMNWMSEGDNYADLDNNGIVNFKDYAMYCRIQWQDQPAEVFTRSSIAFDDGQEIAIDVPRQRKVLLVSNSDGQILSGGGYENKYVSPYVVIGDTIYGIDSDDRLSKSIDGINWTRTAYTSKITRLFRTPQGNLFTFKGVPTRQMLRSSDGGETFVDVTPTGDNAMEGTGYPTSWSVRSHENTIMYVEYGPSTEILGGRYIFRSTDDGVTWERVFDAATLTDDPNRQIRHFHGVAYHAASGRWIATAGDGLSRRCNLYSENNGDTWHLLTTPQNYFAQPLTFIDYGDNDYLLAADDSAHQLSLMNARTGEHRQIYGGLSRESECGFFFDLAYHDGLFYAISGSTNWKYRECVILVSPDLVHWSVYHRFKPQEYIIWGTYAGFLNGRLHWRVQIMTQGPTRHFAISPAKVSLVDGTLITPSVENILSAENSSFETGTGGYSGGGGNISKSDEASLHGDFSLKLELDSEYSGSLQLNEPGTFEAGKTYVAMAWVKGGPLYVQAPALYLCGGPYYTYLGPVHYFAIDDDDQWHLVYSTPCTIKEEMNVTKIRFYLGMIAGAEPKTVYVDSVQIAEVPMKPWHLGEIVQAEEVLTATVSVPAAWTDIFALQTPWLADVYDVADSLYIKTWKLDDNNFISLKFNTYYMMFYLEQVVDGLVETTISSTQYWVGNAILKFALQVSQSEVKLTIQNGRSIEILYDNGYADLISDDITLIYGDVNSENQFPAIVCNEWEWDVIVPYWLGDNEIAEVMNLTAPSFEIMTTE